MTRKLLFLLSVVLLPSAVLGEDTESGLSGRAELSYVQSQGSSEAKTFALKAGLQADYRPNRYVLNAGALYSEADGEESDNRWTAEGRYERLLNERLFAFLSLEYIKDLPAGYDARVSGGPGIGYSFLKSRVQRLDGRLSYQYTYENQTDGDIETYNAAKLAGDYSRKLPAGLRFKQYADYHVSLEDTEDYHVNSETGLEAKVNDHLALGLSYTVHYRNVLPDPDAEHVDRTFLTSLVLDY